MGGELRRRVFLDTCSRYASRARKSVRWTPGGEAVNKSTIVGRVADRMGLTRSMAEGAVDTVLEAIGEAGHAVPSDDSSEILAHE